MKKIYIYSLLFLMLISCNGKKNTNNWREMDDSNVISDNFAKDVNEEYRDIIIGEADGERNTIIKQLPYDDIQCFAIDSTELISAKKLLNESLRNYDSIPALDNFYRQYLGFKSCDNKFVYVNLFSHYLVRGELHPALDKVLYSEDSGGNNFGYAIIDLNSDSIVNICFNKNKGQKWPSTEELQ